MWVNKYQSFIKSLKVAPNLDTPVPTPLFPKEFNYICVFFEWQCVTTYMLLRTLHSGGSANIPHYNKSYGLLFSSISYLIWINFIHISVLHNLLGKLNLMVFPLQTSEEFLPILLSLSDFTSLLETNSG